jgi:peptidoglycan/LPS O-acetylase OafA/YrhL
MNFPQLRDLRAQVRSTDSRIDYIDGLRAIAVLCVIAFHSSATLLPGGFLGVDVFFVISGYVIAGRILPLLAAQQFSLRAFWAARIRRIVPALMVLLILVLPLAYGLISPLDIVPLATGIAASALMLSNWWLAGLDDYFAPAFGSEPLLHTWSLAVEWQFYLFFPILVVFAWRLGGRRGTLIALALTGVVSLLIALCTARLGNMASFYSPVSRAWEFALGALCLLFAGPVKIWRGAAFLALLTLLSAMVLFDSTVVTPGITTLIPVLATGGLILSVPVFGPLRRVLEHPVLVHIGRISFSLYLFHQPALFFARQVIKPEDAPIFWALTLTYGLSLLTWRFIEEPFRRPRTAQRRRVNGYALAGAVVFVLASAVTLWWGGSPWRFGPEVQQLSATAADFVRPNACLSTTTLETVDPSCRFPSADGKLPVMLIGDSHALAVSKVLAESLAAEDIGFQYLASPGCVPLPGFYRPGRPNCDAVVRRMLEIARASDTQIIILVGRFTAYLSGAGFDNGEGGVEAGTKPIDTMDAPTPTIDAARQARVQLAYGVGLRDLLADFAVVLVDPIPEAGWNVPRVALRQWARSHVLNDISTSLTRYDERNAPVLSVFARIADPRLFRVESRKAFCETATGRCLNTKGDTAYYEDDDHLTAAGARQLVPFITQQVRAALYAPR